MPLKKSPTPAAFKANVRAEVKAGKPVKQAVAIYSGGPFEISASVKTYMVLKWAGDFLSGITSSSLS